MLRFTPSLSAEAAVSYFREQFVRGDYYKQGGETVGRWIGKGAEMLGLTGDVDEDAYRSLCHNLMPDSSGPLTPITRDNRRVGYDATFSAPKSVSLGAVLDGDKRIEELHIAAVREVMQRIEEDMKTRVRMNDENTDRVTGNIVAAEFTHSTARPIKGIPDPQLHTHVFMFNATFDGVEGRWKAGQFGDLKADARYYEAMYHLILSKSLADAGYAVHRRGKDWELGGVDREMIEAFSRRTAEVEREADRLGITDPEKKAELGRRTRKKKDQARPQDEIRVAWRETAEGVGYRGIERGGSHNRVTAAEAINFALEKGFERHSVLRERDVLADAMRQGFGTLTPVEIMRQFDSRNDLIRRPVEGDPHFTTQAMLQEEQEVLAFARNGINRHAPFKAAEHQFVNAKLDQEQRDAVNHILRSRDRVTLVRGVAGSGKTTLMKEAVAAIESQGFNVVVLAPTVSASREGLRKDGFTNADTLASFLVDPAKQHAAKNQVIWIDEIGQVGMRDMNQLAKIARDVGARVLGTGDARQHGPIAHGDTMRLMESEAGIAAFTVKGIKRQKSAEYRLAVQLLADGKTVQGYVKLHELGAVREVADNAERLSALGRHYIDVRDAGKDVLIVAPTHAEGRAVTRTLRGELFNIGLLQGEERTFQRLDRQDWSIAERKDPHRYEENMVVQFQRATVGFKSGEKVTVRGRNADGDVQVVRANGTVKTLRLDAAACFAVFKPEELSLAVGDRVRATGKGMTADQESIINRDRELTVAGFTRSGNILTTNGWEIKKDFGHLAHGYTSTSHAAQGKTVDVVLISQPAESFGAANQSQWYVSISRAREQAIVYTGDSDQLKRAIQKSTVRTSATELARQPMSIALAHQVQLQRRAAEEDYVRGFVATHGVRRGIEAIQNPSIIRERGRGR